MPDIDFPALLSHLLAQFRGSLYGIHGQKHWHQVEKNALLLAEKNQLPADLLPPLRLFALLHDSQRVNDDWDQGHGQRAADYARSLQGTHFTLPPDLLKKLEKACARHELGETTLDPFIGTCWDADRLDLIRLGATHLPKFMSTPAGKSLATPAWR